MNTDQNRLAARSLRSVQATHANQHELEKQSQEAFDKNLNFSHMESYRDGSFNWRLSSIDKKRLVFPLLNCVDCRLDQYRMASLIIWS